MTFAPQLIEMKDKLETLGHIVFIPSDTAKHLGDPTLHDDLVRDNEHAAQTDIFRDHANFIEQSDAILVLNLEKNGIPGYCGISVLMEIGLAYYLRKKIFLLNSIAATERYAEDVRVLGAISLNGDLMMIK